MSKQIHIPFVLACVFLLHHYGEAQNFTRYKDWKRYRKELTFHTGASQFLGDLGGLNKAGTDYSPVDVEASLTRPAVSVGYRYKILKNMNWHSSFNYLLVAGDDKLTTDIYRNNRNLNFKSNIFELSTRIEFSIFSNLVGHRYGIKKTMARRHKSRAWEWIAFVGVGGFYYNPKGMNPNTGQYIALRPLHTEGQGLSGGPAQYGKFSVSIPMGMAYRLVLSKKWSFGVELNYRKTFTDYIDDVSTSYYNKNELQRAYGSTTVLMADPSKGDIKGATAPDAAGNGAQRGDLQKDSYMALQITVGRFIAPKRGKTRLRSKF